MCGNLTLFGRLLPGETKALPPRVEALAEAMLHVSQLRGAQSGGAAVQVAYDGLPRQRIVKCLNGKRANLGTRLTRLSAREGARPAFGSCFLLHAHVRYATSGVATREESHPFRYVEATEHGPRRVFRIDALAATPRLGPIETAITHNGDLDAFRFRGVRLPHPDLGWFMERVLAAPHSWLGDSPALAGAIELFLTQGMWLESLRLAYLETVCPPPPDLARLAGEATGSERAALVRALLADYPVPTRDLLAQLAETAERFWVVSESTQKGRKVHRVPFAQRLADGLSKHLDLTRPTLEALALRALCLFLDHDLFAATRAVETHLEGTFGCVITSTLEPDTVVAFARGQPLSLGIQAATGTVAIASERNALRIRDPEGQPVFDARFDFDLFQAEIARISLQTSLPQLTLHSVGAGATYSRTELEVSGRLVPLRESPLMTALPAEPERRVRTDLLAIPDLLRAIRTTFADQASYDRRSAEAFAEQLLSAPRPKLLVVGITNDLWLGQQFVRNLRLCLPSLSAEAESSNELLQDAGKVIDPETVVLAISQSGQDFPTLAALCQLRTKLGPEAERRLFVLSGEHDTLMAQAVGQSFAKRAPWLGRVFANGGGYRPSEAATASISATHATLCEILLLVCERAQERSELRSEIALDADELAQLSARRDACVDWHAAAIVGGAGPLRVSEIARIVSAQSRRWSRHLLEGIMALFAAALVLELNLQWEIPLRPSGVLRLLSLGGPESGTLQRVLATLGTQVDVIYYVFLAPVLVWLLRWLQRRPLLHRQGTRELLIGDVSYVRQTVWLLARRLFSLSYGFASIKPYAADNQDDLVMTHEPLRGTLALFGLPDARRAHLRGHAAAAAMSAKQFASSRSLGGQGAELLTVGHAPRGPTPGPHLSLPTEPSPQAGRELDLLVEGMFDSWERMLSMQTLLVQVAEAVAAFYPLSYDPSRTKDQVFAPTTASPVSAASFLGLGSISRAAARFSRVSLPFDIMTRTRMSRLPGARAAPVDVRPAAREQDTGANATESQRGQAVTVLRSVSVRGIVEEHAHEESERSRPPG